METGTQQIRVIQAAPGRGKTQYICGLISKRIHQERFVVALRSKKCASNFEDDVREKLGDSEQAMVRVIYSDDEQESVASRLEVAIKDDTIRLIIICQKALDTYPKWAKAQGQFTLFIDELFDAAFFAHLPLPESAAKILDIHKDNYQSVSIDALRAVAKTAYDQNKGSGLLARELLALMEHLRDAKHISLKSHKDGFKVVVIREARILDNLQYFTAVYLAAMALEGTLPHLVAKARGFRFIASDWEMQGSGFAADDTVTIIPLMKREASQNYLNDPKNAQVKNFERQFKRAIEILKSKGVPGKIHIMVNKEAPGRDRLGVIERLGLRDEVIDMGFNTHGHHDWQEGRLFALLYVSRWNRDFTAVGEKYAETLGITLDELIRAYEVTMQLEPVCQSATRGQVRKREYTKSSWIIVLDTRTASYLKDTILHRARIDESHLEELSSEGSKMTAPKNAGIKSVVKRKWSLSETQAKRIYRKCQDGGLIDVGNPDHLIAADDLVRRLYPEVVSAGTEYVLS